MQETRTATHERAGGAARGGVRLASGAVTELTRIVEGMHANIAAAAPPLGAGTDGRARGLAGLVYAGIRRVNGAAGLGLDHALGWLEHTPLADLPLPQPHWDALLSAANGVFGDHLAAEQNPLAIPMQLRCGARPVDDPGPGSGRLLVLVHGLCMNDRQWQRAGHDHGAALARELGYAPVYAFYNSGRHVSENGRALAERLEGLVASAPTPIDELAIVGHSMGGLVARSACRFAAERRHGWLGRLRQLVFLGTPHHGAPLERAGSTARGLAELSPYVAPLGRLGDLRSAGITDLRHGSVCDEDWRDPSRRAGPPLHAPLPEGVACHAIASRLARRGPAGATDLLGDGLVPLASALGRHRDPARCLDFPEHRRWVGAGIGHLELLSHPRVYAVLRGWLAGEESAPGP